MKFKPSKYQQAVFENVATGTGHTVIKAVAGSGKSTTILESLTHIPAGLSTLFVAFNKPIAENLGKELKKRGIQGTEASTLHSYGLKTVTASLGRLRINGNRVYDLMDVMHTEGVLEVAKAIFKVKATNGDTDNDEEVAFEVRRDLSKAVSLAKGALASDEKDIDAIIDSFDIETPKRSPVPGLILTESEQNAIREAFIRDVLALLLRCTDTAADGQLDFDDMIWLPVVMDLRQRKFDRVFVDETQDLNPAQIEMVMRAIKPSGRICAVGDPRQAIYRFRGADSAAVDNVVKRLDATILPLSVCYRCCKAVVLKAKEIVPEIEWAENAEEGIVSDATVGEMVSVEDGAQPGDFILSRTNAPLISLCMRFLKEGRAATIQGRDIGASLSAFVKKSAARNVAELCNYVEEWRDVECKRLSVKRRDTQAVEDRADCVLALSEGARTVADVINRIESLFADKDDSSRIVLSSTHKAKGMERDRVWMLTSTYMRRDDPEESNLAYVAYSRARKVLFLVQGDLKKRDGQ